MVFRLWIVTSAAKIENRTIIKRGERTFLIGGGKMIFPLFLQMHVTLREQPLSSSRVLRDVMKKSHDAEPRNPDREIIYDRARELNEQRSMQRDLSFSLISCRWFHVRAFDILQADLIFPKAR